MGQGLGENSPVVLTLGKANYEAMIERHGQWVRWRVAEKCPCVRQDTQQPDIHCERCGGLGVVYGCQKARTVTKTALCTDDSGIVEIEDEEGAYELQCVYDQNGNAYPDARKLGRYILLGGEPSKKGIYVTAVLTETILKTAESAECEALGAGYYRVPGLQSSKKGEIDGLYHAAPGDIEDIGSLTDAAGREWGFTELRQDTFLLGKAEAGAADAKAGEAKAGEAATWLAETAIAGESAAGDAATEDAPKGPLTARGVSYIPPFVFVLLNQNLSRTEEATMQELGGDAVVTFPYSYDVSNDDIITVLSGTYAQKSIITKRKAQYDVIPAYFVGEVASCSGKDRDFAQGVDFLLAGTNYIKWISENRPADGEAYSITYRVFPTYKVVKAIPQIRTSENQRMPKKAVVKLYDTYGEARRANRQ